MLTHNCTSVLSTDCYVAVTGLPNPQPDHAVIMCKFAQECMNAMVELFPGLVDALGADTATLRMVRDSAEHVSLEMDPRYLTVCLSSKAGRVAFRTCHGRRLAW